MTTRQLLITANTMFIIYCVALVWFISSMNSGLKTIVDVETYTPSSLQVKPVIHRKGLQVTADQWRVQKAANHNGTQLVQRSQHNRWSNMQVTDNNYHDRAIQKSSQINQYDLLNAKLVQ